MIQQSKRKRELKNWIKYKVLGFLQNPSGAVAFEYVLILGTVSIASIGTMVFAPTIFDKLITATCAAMDWVVLPIGTISC